MQGYFLHMSRTECPSQCQVRLVSMYLPFAANHVAKNEVKKKHMQCLPDPFHLTGIKNDGTLKTKL